MNPSMRAALEDLVLSNLLVWLGSAIYRDGSPFSGAGLMVLAVGLFGVRFYQLLTWRRRGW